MTIIIAKNYNRQKKINQQQNKLIKVFANLYY